MTASTVDTLTSAAEVFGPQLDEWIATAQAQAFVGAEQTVADLFLTFERQPHERVAALLAVAVVRLAGDCAMAEKAPM